VPEEIINMIGSKKKGVAIKRKPTSNLVTQSLANTSAVRQASVDQKNPKDHELRRGQTNKNNILKEKSSKRKSSG
jgi:hypothetical protein